MTGKLNLAYNINRQKQASILKIFKVIFLGGSLFSGKLKQRVKNIFNKYLLSKQDIKFAVKIK